MNQQQQQQQEADSSEKPPTAAVKKPFPVIHSKRYQSIWDRVLEVPGRRIGIKMKIPSESQFKTLRKAFWKVKNEDLVNRHLWRSKCERDGDKIYFWIVPADIKQRF